MAEEVVMRRPRRRVQHPGGGESRTKQADLEKTDIKKILKRYHAGEVVVPDAKPRYGDFSGVGDFHEAMNKVRNAEEEFMALPSEVRKHVGNDVGKFLEMAYDPDRVAELEELGLIEERKPAATKGEPVNESEGETPPREPEPEG